MKEGGGSSTNPPCSCMVRAEIECSHACPSKMLMQFTGEPKLLRATSVSPACKDFTRVARPLFFAMLAALCLWVLHLPLFPMQDGPMHLYLASVLGGLLAKSPGTSVYAHFYTVQHLLPPYSLHYYLLISLMKVLPALWAEKMVVGIILILFCTGIRFLARVNGASGEVFGLFSLAIALNWPLMMGFQNYILSLGIACWALGLWNRGHSVGLRCAFVGCCWLAALTHPVPLLLILGFTCCDLILRAAAALLNHVSLRKLPPGWSPDAIAFVCASTLLFYLRAFTDKHRSAQDLHALASLSSRVHYFAGLHGIDFFNRANAGGLLLQLALYAILLLCIGFGGAAFLRQRTHGEWKPAYTWLIVTALLTCALPFLPDDLSGSKALVSRLQVVSWIGFIAAASGFAGINRRWTTAVITLALATASGSLALGQSRLLPIAQRIYDVVAPVNDAAENKPLPAAGSRGILLSAREEDDASFAAVAYEPLHWQAAAYFRQSHTVLLNTPWMDSTWLPLGAKPTLLTKDFDPWIMECYHCLRQQLVASAVVRSLVLPQTDFIVFVDQSGNATQARLDEVLKADPSYQWSCEHHDWLWLCEKRSPASRSPAS